jgi:hypothetical protein
MAKRITWKPDGSMTSEDDKITPNEVEHKCLYGNKVAEMHGILTGNGTPEKGMVSRLLVIKERQDGVLVTLGKIDSTLKEIINNNNGLLEEIIDVRTSVISFRSEMTGKEVAEEKARKEKKDDDEKKATRIRDRNWRIAQLVGIVLTIIGLYIGYGKLHTGQTEIKDETKITNEILVPPGATRGSSIIIIPIKDTTKTKEDIQ